MLNDKSKIKLLKTLVSIFIMVLSRFVLAAVIPETEFVQSSVEHLEESENTVMDFSGATIAISLAITALPDDFATPLATTISDMNGYFIFIFVVLFVEKLLVLEGTKLSFAYIIPVACLLYILSIISKKEIFKKFATKLVILGISIVVVIPFSVQVTEYVGASYLSYVDETIAEAEAGADKVTEIVSTSDGEATIFEKLSDAFKTAMDGMSDLLKYFENVIKKCVNAIAIMLVTSFVLPLLNLLFFRWLLKELFSLNLSNALAQIRLPQIVEKKLKGVQEDEEDEA